MIPMPVIRDLISGGFYNPACLAAKSPITGNL
jgi:hypothetical protein